VPLKIAGVEAVSINGSGAGGLDLPAVVASVEDEVVAVALSPGLGHAETEAGGFVEDSGFGDLAAALGREMDGGRRGAADWCVFSSLSQGGLS